MSIPASDTSPQPEGIEQAVPTLSVTVLNYNYAHYLPRCLDSILSQTWTDFELILINDRSTDNSLEVIQPYLKDPRVRLIDHAINRGFVSSLLEGCELSRGRYITVISADDYALDPSAFETACVTLDGDKAISLFYSAWRQVDINDRLESLVRGADHDYVANGVDEFKKLLISMPLIHSGTMIRRSAYDAVGGYDTQTRYVIDNIMWLALCSTGKVAYVDKPLYAYRMHASNMTNTERGVWGSTAEWLRGVDLALARFPDDILPNKASLKRQAYKFVLLSGPMHDIFRGYLRRGWAGYWEAFRRYPVLTSCQPKTVSFVLRTILGARLYRTVLRLRVDKRIRLQHVGGAA